jgi:IS30 family transposase
MRSYSHLSEDERNQIGVLRAAGRSMVAIARVLGRAKATITSPLRRARGARRPPISCLTTILMQSVAIHVA